MTEYERLSVALWDAKEILRTAKREVLRERNSISDWREWHEWDSAVTTIHHAIRAINNRLSTCRNS